MDTIIEKRFIWTCHELVRELLHTSSTYHEESIMKNQSWICFLTWSFIYIVALWWYEFRMTFPMFEHSQCSSIVFNRDAPNTLILIGHIILNSTHLHRLFMSACSTSTKIIEINFDDFYISWIMNLFSLPKENTRIYVHCNSQSESFFVLHLQIHFHTCFFHRLRYRAEVALNQPRCIWRFIPRSWRIILDELKLLTIVERVLNCYWTEVESPLSRCKWRFMPSNENADIKDFIHTLQYRHSRWWPI